MKKILILPLIILLFAGCMSTKRYTSFVEPEIPSFQGNSVIRPPNITFDLSALDSTGRAVESQKLKSLFIPALFYWRWNNSVQCTLDQKMVAGFFCDEFLKHADTLGLLSRLEGRHLNLKIGNIPNKFVYLHEGDVVILIIYYMTSDRNGILPQCQGLVGDFRITNPGRPLIQEPLNIQFDCKPMSDVRGFPRPFTKSFLEHFRENISVMARSCVLRIMDEV